MIVKGRRELDDRGQVDVFFVMNDKGVLILVTGLQGRWGRQWYRR